MDQRVPRVEIIGVLGFVRVHVWSNDQVSRLLLRGSVIRIDPVALPSLTVSIAAGWRNQNLRSRADEAGLRV